MLERTDILPSNFNYLDYLNEFGLAELVGNATIPKEIESKTIHPPLFSVDQNNKTPFPVEYDDLIRLHYLACSRKVTTILEFGLGKSTSILGNALFNNKKRYYKYTSSKLRRGNLYQCYSVDNYQSWIDECKRIIPKDLLENKIINIELSTVITGQFQDKICTYYDPLPNICPDFIYLDGPDQFSAKGDIRGLSTKHQDRMPMAADILSIEHFLQPGTLIVVDGRTANARFLLTNLQRKWGYYHSEDWDQHFFELQEIPLGIYNKNMIDHCLGEEYYQRLGR